MFAGPGGASYKSCQCKACCGIDIQPLGQPFTWFASSVVLHGQLLDALDKETEGLQLERGFFQEDTEGPQLEKGFFKVLQ